MSETVQCVSVTFAASLQRHIPCAPQSVAPAMASTTGSLWVSGDAGASWETVSANFPPVVVVKFV